MMGMTGKKQMNGKRAEEHADHPRLLRATIGDLRFQVAVWN
jgi:hypothetical protein